MRTLGREGFHLLARMAHLAIKGLSIMGVFLAVEWSDAYFGDDV